MNSLYSATRNHLIFTDGAKIASVTAESDALTAGTPANWLDVTSWRGRTLEAKREADGYAAIKEFDLEISCDATETITSPRLYGVRALPQTLADDDVDTVDHANDELDITSHTYVTGDGPVRMTTSDTLPAGLEKDVDYWVRYVGSGTISLHPTLADAVAGTNKVAFSDGGTGTHTVVDVQGSANPDDDTKRLHWFLYGALNSDATITVGAQLGFMERIQHSPMTLYYEVGGTSGTGAQTLTIRACPVQTVEW